MNRICLSEEVLSAYLSGKLSGEERLRAERHIANCDTCRKTLGEAYDVLKSRTGRDLMNLVLSKIKENAWGISSLVLFVFSFVVSKYFFQLLSAAILAGAKWIIDAKATRTLIMIHEAHKKDVHSRNNHSTKI